MGIEKSKALQAISRVLESEVDDADTDGKTHPHYINRRKDRLITARRSGASEEEIALQIVLSSNNLNNTK